MQKPMLQAAGIIVIHRPSNKILLVRHTQGHWGFAKGSIEKSESPLQAAIRELFEETRIRTSAIASAPVFEEKYQIAVRNGRRTKKVTYFIGITCDENILIDRRELSDAGWFTPSEAATLETFPSRGLLSKIQTILSKDRLSFSISPKPLSRITHRSVTVQGSKHAYSRLAPLAVFNRKLNLTNAPNTIDTHVIHEVIRRSKASTDKLLIPEDLCHASRSIMNLIPALLHRHKNVTFFSVKGCNIGERKIDIYLDILKKFGARIRHDGGAIHASIRKPINTGTITLPFPSFTGTSMALMMASLFTREVKIENCSTEPEILELADALQMLGIRIRFASERTAVVHGRTISWRTQTLSVSEDRNALVTQIMGALIQQLPFYYQSKNRLSLSPLAEVFERMGVDFSLTRQSIRLKRNLLSALKPVDIVAGHYPRFCSDWQPLIAPVLAKIHGCSSITDTIFEGRYDYIKEVRKINPSFTFRVKNGTLLIQGGATPVLRPAKTVTARCLDIRSGAANIIAALGERAPVEITGIHQLLRGYEDIARDMNMISDRIRFTI